MAYLRTPSCSPYKLIWAYLVPDRSPAGVIHRRYAEYVFNQKGLKHWAKLIGMMFAWPVVFLSSQRRFTARLAPQVRAATGKSISKQVLEQFWMSFAYSISPRKYYVVELFRDERRRNARHYVMRYEFKGGLHNVLEMRNDRSTRHLVNDKALFAERCAQRGVSAVRAFLAFSREGVRTEYLHKGPGLPRQNLFVKPLGGKGGRGCEIWTYVEADRYRSSKGEIIAEAQLEQRLKMLAQKGPDRGRAKGMVVQPFLRNHPDFADISDLALTTMRIMSVRNEHGGFEVTHAVFKMPLKKGAIVDNFHAGGIVCRVDVATGTLGPASDSGSKKACVWFDAHPVTGRPITGRRLPLWEETKRTVEAAHAVFPDRTIIGWDVAITPDGPCIVEGNVQSGCDMIQRTHDLPVGLSRLGEAYAYNVEQALKRSIVTRQHQVALNEKV